MRAFGYVKVPERLLIPEIVQMMGSIHEHKGRRRKIYQYGNAD